MKKKEVVVGRTYMAKVSGRVVPIKLIAESPYGGWNGVNEATGRAVHVRSAARLRWEHRQPVEGVSQGPGDLKTTWRTAIRKEMDNAGL